MKTDFNKVIKESFKITVPVMAGYVFLGITFGLVTETSGFSWWIPILMSTVIFSGALEFAAVPILSATFDPFGAFILGITLSARHLFYGIPMLKKYENTGKAKPFLIFGLTDETFSILSTTDVRKDINPKQFYLFVTLFDFLYWNIGTAFGALLGNVLTVDLQGLDFVLTALFIVLFLEQIKTKTGLISGFAGLIISALTLTLFGSSSFVIIAMLFIIVILIAGRRIISHE